MIDEPATQDRAFAGAHGIQNRYLRSSPRKVEENAGVHLLDSDKLGWQA
jgi:hypothetical protein